MPTTPFTRIDEKTLLSNPFSENRIGGNAFGTKPVGDSGIVIKTKDPIVTSKKPFTFTNASQSEWDARKKLNENLIKTKEEAEKTWWQKQTKTAKTIYVSVGVLAIGLLGYYAYKKFGKNN